MKYIDKKISDSFFQIYIILDKFEKKELYLNIKKTYLEYKQDIIKSKIAIYKTISSKAKSNLSMDMINKLNQELKYLTLDTIYLKEEEIADGLCEELILDILSHIEQLNITQVFNKEASIIGSIDDDNSITLIYSFCFVKSDYDLKFPTAKGNGYLFTKQDLDMVETEILLGGNYYKMFPVDKVSQFSDITFTYIKNDTIQENAIMDISTMEMALDIDREALVGLDRNTHILKNNRDETFTLIIKEIKDKEIFELTDDLVKKINFLDTKTVKEFRNKINKIYSYVLNVNSNVMSILKNMTAINDFKIDSYVGRYYAKKLGVEYNNNIIEKNIKEIKIGFITSLIFSMYNINIDKYVSYIEDEFKLISLMKKISGTKTFEDYFNIKAPIYALYDFFKSKNLVTERKNYE